MPSDPGSGLQADRSPWRTVSGAVALVSALVACCLALSVAITSQGGAGEPGAAASGNLLVRSARAALDFDRWIFSQINSHAGSTPFIDSALGLIAESYVFKGIPVMLVWWGLWFTNGPARTHDRQGLLASLGVSIAAIAIGRSLAAALPFRHRPLHDPSIDVSIGSYVDRTMLEGWSSFPSDHAILFFSLAVCLFQVHRIWGTLLLLHALLIVSVPRIFLGFHFPSDILAGAAVGILIGLVLLPVASRVVARANVLGAEQTRGHLFYPAVFLITLQVATTFDSGREILRAAASLLSRLPT